MFGWLKKRQERELIKLVHQNFLAFSFLTAEQEAAEEDGLQLASRFSEKLETSRQLSLKFLEKKSLSVDEQDLTLELNREARAIYEPIRKEWKELGEMYSSKLELAPKFDDKFKPLLGWDDYIEEWKVQD